MPQILLPLGTLAVNHPGLTAAVAANLCEAASVCLNRHHKSPVVFIVSDNNLDLDATVDWQIPTAQCLAAHANETKATEEGACACALAAVEIMHKQVAVRQAETRTGADYYLGKPDQLYDDLEACDRLEVSGVDQGNPNAVDGRLRQKIKQTQAGRSNLPAMAAVVGFAARLIKIQRAP